MEDDGGDVADSNGVYADFGPEQDYTLLGMDGPPPSLQGEGCFRADSVDIMMPEVGGQGAGCLQQPGPKDVQQTVALVVTVASVQQMSESSRGSDGKNPAEQRDESMECTDNPPGALIHVEGLCCSHKSDENFEDQERLSDHLRLHTKRCRSPGSGDQARARAKRPRSARTKRGLEGETGDGSSAATAQPQWAEEDPCPVRDDELPGASVIGNAGQPPAECSGVPAISCPHRSCGLAFRTAAELADHRRVHLQFRCDRCDVACSSAALLAQHKKRSRAKSKKSSCDLCPFRSCAPRDLNKHYSATHRDKAAYACNRCDFISRYRKVLKKHLTAHSDDTGSAAEENDEQEERRQELDGGNVEAQTWPGEQQPSACDEEDPVSETGSEGDRNRKNNSLRQRHFKVDVQEGMEHLYKTHICPECKRCFKKRTHLVEHLHLHFPDPSLQCPHCQKFFTSKGKLKVHLMRELGEKTHHCPLCDYSAVEKNSLNRHMASMHENTANFYSEVYACPACEEKFTVSNALKEHMKSHKEERGPLGCTEGGCGYTAPERKDFVRHLHEAHGARAVECRYRTCGSLFGTEAGMEAHRRTHYAFHCDQCDFVCSNKHVFRRHKRRGHPGSEELPCAFCPYKTFNPVEFNDHVGKMHANEKIHKCSECDFATAHKRVLNRHILLHTGEKPHKCELCDFTCRDMGYLSKHMLTHSDNKNYMCTECGYITKWKHYLTVHMRKHTGDLRYHCNQCSYRCHRADQLSSHKLRHQGKSLICEVCGFACKRKYELQKHMQVKHSQDYQMPLHQCRYCSYQTQYKQALLNHENCKHTKQREFRCALCPYKTFSNTGLFFHKRKVHGYVPGDKEWLENYAKEEMAMNSAHILLAYVEANTNPSTSAKRSESWQSKGSSAGEEPGKKSFRPGFEAPAFMQAGVVERYGSAQPDTDSADTGQPMAAQTASGTEQELQTSLSVNDPQPEVVVFGPRVGFPLPPPPEEPAKHISLDDWPPCAAGSMYRDFGLVTADIVREDLGHHEADVGEHGDDEEGGEGDHLVGHHVDVFTHEDRQPSEKAGELGQEAEDSPAVVTCTSSAEPTLHPPPESPNTKDLPGPESREEALLARSESDIQALRRQDKQQAQALVLEGRVEMLVVQTDVPVFKCEGCSYVTRKEKALVLHTKSGCQSKKTPLVCEACGATFKQQRGLNTHRLKKCPAAAAVAKKGRLYPCPAAAREPPAALFDSDVDSDSKAADPRGSPTATGQQANAGQLEGHEPCPDPDKPAQPRSEITEISAAEDLAGKEACQPAQPSVDGNTLLEEEDISRTLEEKTVDGASPGSGETLLLSQGAGVKFTFAQETYSCTACPFTSSSQLAMGDHVSVGCGAPVKLPCGLCKLLFRSERALRNHRAIKHRGEAAAGGEVGSGPGSASEGEGEEKGVDRRRRFTCPSCPFTCCQQRAMDTHKKKGCMKPDELQCRLCSFVCKSAGALRQHALLHGYKGSAAAPTRRSRLRCQLCPFSCKQARCLQQHVALKHDGAKPHKCSYCDFRTARRYRLEAHESLHTGVGRLACDACQRTFGTGSKLRVHKLRVHDKTPTHFCALCDYSGYNHNDISRHVGSCHAGQPSAACSHRGCGARFSSEGALKQHRLRLHRDRAGGCHGCPSCLFACRSESTLRSHLQRQHPQLQCPSCKLTFPGRPQLEEHKKIHFHHRCQLCPFAARERQQLVQHLLDCHEEEADGPKPLRCPTCGFTCRHQLVFDHHMKAHGGTRLYKCTDCDYTTKNRQKITWHIRIHTGEKPYKCHLCSYACADPSRLKYHMRIHQEERKYLCPDCGYKCKWINQLKYHMTKHTGAKPYRCDQCDYRSNRADALRTHKETRHKEARSFICEQCGKGFKTRFLLKTHLKKHSEEKPHVCGVCRRGFRWQAGLRHHYLTHTNEHPFFCRHCSYKAKQKFQVVKHIRRHHPLKAAAGDPSAGVGKVPVTHTLGSRDPLPALPLQSAAIEIVVTSEGP
ncbi:zinc finger protein 142 isoform X2 [Amblyraja radiata]|uniref:zinc finger protein 142 isoform X2 n=1 Tax=Amblyraja radiata TaxID=386614 RepID=UPI001401D3D7|nr:zinc finger protein 142 isoform X2 [Amblyraja radiata]